ncbi:MAG: TonB family protein, partial [Acidobacteriota bacterium]
SPSSSAAGPVQATASQPRPTPSVADPGSSEDPIVSGPVTEPPDESPNAPANEPPTPQSTTGTQARQDPADRPQDAPARTEPFRTELAHADTTQADEPTTPDEADRIAQQNPSPPDGGSPEAPITEPPAASDDATTPVIGSESPTTEPAPATRPTLLSLKPALLEPPQPTYPALARHRKQEAQVTLAVLVDGHGKVLRALVTRSNDPGLGFDEAARQAALAASFHPAIRDGKPIQEWAELTIEFRLP